MSEPSAPAGATSGFEMSVPADPESLDVVHEALQELWDADDSVSDLDRMRFETGTMEVLGNVVEHAWRVDDNVSGRRLEIAVTITADRLLAVCGDDGRPAEIDLSAVTMPGEDAESGRGLALALAALDDLAYSRAGGRNTWALTCLRGRS